MNAITTLETSQLNVLNSLNESLKEKEYIIAEQKFTIAELKNTKKEHEDSIESLTMKVMKLNEELTETKIKLKNEEETHFKSKVEFERKNDLIRA